VGQFVLPKAVLAYALAGAARSTVYPVSAVDGTLSRNSSSEDVALYEAPRPVTCFAYFTGPASGAWRMSHPHSAGHRRFEEPVPLPASLPVARGTSPPPGGPAS